jgi:thymidylate synthase
MWQQRSADVFLGLPYDIAMYGILLEMLAKGAGLKPGRLIGQLGDCHLYNNHIDQANEFLYRHSNPKCAELELDYGVFIDSKFILHIPELSEVRIKNYNPLPAISAPLSVGK